MKQIYLMSDAFVFIRNGKSIKQNSESSGVPITRIETIADKSIDKERLGYAGIDINQLEEFEKYLLQEGDILMSHINSPKHLGKTAVYQNEPKYLIHGMNLLCLRVNTEICNSKYANYFFQSRMFNQDLMKISNKSVNQASFSVGRLKELKIPLPPLKTQKHIAQILNDAAALRDKTKQLLKEYDLLAQSIFLDMFGDVLNNPKSWKTKTIEELVVNEKGSIKRGPFGGALKKEIFVEQGYLVYEQYHALNNDFNFERYYIDDENFERLKGFEVKPGDIIISCSGVYLGKLAVIPKDAKKGIINQALLKVTLDEQKMRKDFFVFHFTQDNFRDRYFGANRGAGIPNFPPMASFKKFPFIAPPINLQNQFAEKIALIEQQKALAKQELQESEHLFNCLLQQAFKGELV